MEFGVNLNNREPLITSDYTLADLLDLAEVAESRGFGSVWRQPELLPGRPEPQRPAPGRRVPQRVPADPGHGGVHRQGRGLAAVSEVSVITLADVPPVELPGGSWSRVLVAGGEDLVMVFSFPSPDYPPTERRDPASTERRDPKVPRGE